MNLFELSDSRKSLYQYDTGRKLIVDDITVTTVHMSNLSFGKAYVVEVSDGTCAVPDELLQAPGKLHVWAFLGNSDNGYTKKEEQFDIVQRAKPMDYVFTPTEQKTIYDLYGKVDDFQKVIDSGGVIASIEQTVVSEEDGGTNVAAVTLTNESVTYFEFKNGSKGSDGNDGKDGTNGEDGYTPVRGVDYWTEDDKKQILSYTDEIWTSIKDIKEYLGYTDTDVAGLCVDYQNRTFKRLAGACGKTAGADFDVFPMFGGRKRCNVLDDGTITAYYGDENYTEDGTNGQVMVYQPKFYYKVVPLVFDKNTVSNIGYNLRKANYYVSTIPKTGFKLHPAFYDANGNEVDYILLSAYEGSMYDASAESYVNDNVDESIAYASGDLLCSVAGKKPISGLRTGMGTKAIFEAMANNRGSGWHIETIKAASANQLLMIIELGTMNTQTGIAHGVTNITDNSAYNCSSLTGSTAELGNGTGSATETINEIAGTETTYNTNGRVSVSYRGVENPWGNIWKHIQGANIWGDGTMGGGQPYIANNFTFNESKNSDNYEPVGFTLTNASGYINAMGYGNEEFDWLLMPSEIGGTSAFHVGDYTYVTDNLNGYRIAQLGGIWYSGSYAGGFSWRSGSVGDRGRSIGGRLLYVPTA